MTKISITIMAAAISVFGLVFVSSASADTHSRISGDGSGTDNRINIEQDNRVNIRQLNDTSINNDVSINNTTGHNSSTFNTGGDVRIRTGDADANVSIQNTAGENAAHVSGVNRFNDGQDVSIHGNGAFSDNKARITNDNFMRLNQENNTDIANNVSVNNNTGFNRASGNTSYSRYKDGGDVRIDTGDATANVDKRNEAGLNKAQLSQQNNNAESIVNIHGNGAFSDNRINISNDSDRIIRQNNDSNFDNQVKVNNNTGDNFGDAVQYSRGFDNNKYFTDRNFNKDSYDDNKSYSHDMRYADYQTVTFPNSKYIEHYVDYNKVNDEKIYFYGNNNAAGYADHYLPGVIMLYPTSSDCDTNSYDRQATKHFTNNSSYDCVKQVSYESVNNQKPYVKYVENKKYDNKSKPVKYGESDHFYQTIFPYGLMVHHGNTGGNVTISTGDANGHVNFGNYATANILY